MKKDITIGEKTVPMSASALTTLLFKNQFGEDLIKGMQNLQKDAQKGEVDLIFVSKMAWVMAKEYNKDIEPLEEWLSQFEMFDIGNALPEIITFWASNEKQNSVPRKNSCNGARAECSNLHAPLRGTRLIKGYAFVLNGG